MLSIGPTICPSSSPPPPPYIDAILPRTCIMNGWLMTLRRLRKPQPEDGRPGPRSTSGIKHAPLADPRNPRSLLHGLAVYRSNPPPPSPSFRNRYTEADFNSSLTERQQSGSCKQIREAWISGEAILFVNLLSSGYKFNEGVSVLLTRERKICRFVNLLLIIEHY